MSHIPHNARFGEKCYFFTLKSDHSNQMAQMAQMGDIEAASNLNEFGGLGAGGAGAIGAFGPSGGTETGFLEESVVLKHEFHDCRMLASFLFDKSVQTSGAGVAAGSDAVDSIRNRNDCEKRSVTGTNSCVGSGLASGVVLNDVSSVRSVRSVRSVSNNNNFNFNFNSNNLNNLSNLSNNNVNNVNNVKKHNYFDFITKEFTMFKNFTMKEFSILKHWLRYDNLDIIGMSDCDLPRLQEMATLFGMENFLHAIKMKHITQLYRPNHPNFDYENLFEWKELPNNANKRNVMFENGWLCCSIIDHNQEYKWMRRLKKNIGAKIEANANNVGSIVINPVYGALSSLNSSDANGVNGINGINQNNVNLIERNINDLGGINGIYGNRSNSNDRSDIVVNIDSNGSMNGMNDIIINHDSSNNHISVGNGINTDTASSSCGAATDATEATEATNESNDEINELNNELNDTNESMDDDEAKSYQANSKINGKTRGIRAQKLQKMQKKRVRSTRRTKQGRVVVCTRSGGSANKSEESFGMDGIMDGSGVDMNETDCKLSVNEVENGGQEGMEMSVEKNEINEINSNETDTVTNNDDDAEENLNNLIKYEEDETRDVGMNAFNGLGSFSDTSANVTNESNGDFDDNDE